MRVLRLQLVWIINGAMHKRKAPLKEKLGRVATDVLLTSGNTGRDFTDWQIRDANGVLLEHDRTIEDFQFKPCTRLFLNLAVGAGG